jgi:hypothetical protein
MAPSRSTVHARWNSSLGPIRRDVADRWLDSGDMRTIVLALLRQALHGPDWVRAEQLAHAHVHHEDVWVRRNAATAVGHIARVHGQLDTDAALRALHGLRGDPELTDWADAALDDFEMYLGVRHPGTAARPARQLVA